MQSQQVIDLTQEGKDYDTRSTSMPKMKFKRGAKHGDEVTPKKPVEITIAINYSDPLTTPKRSNRTPKKSPLGSSVSKQKRWFTISEGNQTDVQIPSIQIQPTNEENKENRENSNLKPVSTGKKPVPTFSDTIKEPTSSPMSPIFSVTPSPNPTKKMKPMLTPLKVGSPVFTKTPAQNVKVQTPNMKTPKTLELEYLRDMLISLTSELGINEKMIKQTSDAIKVSQENSRKYDEKIRQMNDSPYRNNNVKQEHTTSTQTQTSSKSDPNMVRIGKITFNKADVIDQPSSDTTHFKGLWDDCVPVVVKKVPKENGLKEKENFQHFNKMKESWCEFLVRFIDYEIDGDFAYLAIELCDTNLENFAKGKKDLDSRVLFHDIISGMDFMHKHQQVHGNLNPRNILVKQFEKVTKKQRAKIGSLNTMSEQSREAILSDDDTFIAPELIVKDKKQKSQVTPKSEIYIAGLILYYILTGGEHPFGTEPKFMRIKMQDGKYRLKKLDVEEADSLLQWMLKPKPDERPTAKKVLCHPFFWDNEKREHFLEEVMKAFKKTSFDKNEFNYKEDGTKFFPGGYWGNLIDPGVLHGSTYDLYSVIDYLRLIRNVRHHYLDKPVHIRHTVLRAPRGILPYFLSKSPSIVSHVYTRLLGMKSILNYQDGKLCKYYE
eukprot:TRINITY_DN5925_c0_g1_i1.p1 TRINITY_DN5925_c0_g1~~TRINITY_DN5925_c0_g1_i1.p1  ORF type:complete len:660 (+),score=126.06 TRINITY_DN5925_c0_g1_i1:190-2169(+)